jgi:chorismate lyase/3-hydroxybenzoate synthase
MPDTVSTLQGANLSGVAFSKQEMPLQDSVLGALCFSSHAAGISFADPRLPCMRIAMRRLDAVDSVCEVWHGSAPLTQGQWGDIQYRHDEDVLFGVIVLPEAQFEACVERTPLQQATESAYRQMFALLDSLRFPYLFRVWNYFADINGQSYGLERYRQFNRGRQDAYAASGQGRMGNVPAACALGCMQGPLSIAFLAGRAAPMNIENPRQISAYRYPQQYGPRSPMFSRAALVRLGPDETLFISGTASIVGHETLHRADVVAQTRETITNIEAVLAEANRSRDVARPQFELDSLNFKVYVRHPADLTPIRAELAHIVGDRLKAVYLQADVCRQDLLLEIEADAAHPVVIIPGGRD